MKKYITKSNYQKSNCIENHFQIPKESNKYFRSQYINETNDINEEDYIQLKNMGRTDYEGYDEIKEENDNNKKIYGTIYNYNNISENNVYHEIKSPEKKRYNKYIYNTDYKKYKITSNNLYNSNKYNNTNFYNRNKNYKNEYYSSFKPRNIENLENKEDNEAQKTFNKYETYTEGRVENYYEDNISKDGQYLVTISISKIVNDPVPKTYNNLYESNTFRGYNTYIDKVDDINYISDYKYSNEKIKESRNNVYQEDKKEKKEKEEKKANIKAKPNNDKFGHNYKYYERKENISTSKTSQTYQRMREPIHKTQIYTYNKELPEKEVKTVIKSYKKEIKGNDNKKNMGNYDNLKMVYINATTTKNKSKQFNRNYNGIKKK